jgi:hypothetical protein
MADAENTPKPRLKWDIEQSALECRNAENQLLWWIPVTNIVLMAEYTTNEGPWMDDYFLVFCGGRWQHVEYSDSQFLLRWTRRNPQEFDTAVENRY